MSVFKKMVVVIFVVAVLVFVSTKSQGGITETMGKEKIFLIGKSSVSISSCAFFAAKPTKLKTAVELTELKMISSRVEIRTATDELLMRLLIFAIQSKARILIRGYPGIPEEDCVIEMTFFCSPPILFSGENKMDKIRDCLEEVNGTIADVLELPVGAELPPDAELPKVSIP